MEQEKVSLFASAQKAGIFTIGLLVIQRTLQHGRATGARRELAQLHVVQHIHPDDRPSVAQAMRQMAEAVPHLTPTIYRTAPERGPAALDSPPPFPYLPPLTATGPAWRA